MITEQSVSRVRDASDIVEVIGETVALKKAGKDFKGLCPFHQEKTPSFMVSPSKAIFHCFGCGKGGDVFKFVMETDRCSYPEAIERLAEKKNIPVERDNERAPAERDGKYERKKHLFSILDRAAQFYHKTLLEGREAEAAREYVKVKRRLSDQTIQKFQIGWAPHGPDALVKTAVKAGIPAADLLEAGVAVKSQRDGKILDSFRGRVIFPILDLKGQVIGFGGRILEGQKTFGNHVPPKYLNSSDSLIFQKGKNLYGFYQGSKAIREKDEALLLEGYMDVIAAHQAGVEYAVAPLGTSLTPDQCMILKRYASSVTVLFDMDKAGEAAGIRGAELLLEHGFFPMMARLPRRGGEADAKDIDEFLKNHSSQELEKVLKEKVTLADFRVESLMKEKEGLPMNVRRAQAAKAALSLVSKAKDEIIRGEILKGIASKAQVSLDSLTAEWQKMSNPKKYSAAAEEPAKPAMKPFLSSEEELLALSVMYPELRERLSQLNKDLGLFEGSVFQECFRVLELQKNLSGIPEVLSALSESAASALRAILIRFEKTKTEKPLEIFESIAARMQHKLKEARFKTLAAEAAQILNEGDPDSPKVQEFKNWAPILKGRKE